jgi:hypothetical protein
MKAPLLVVAVLALLASDIPAQTPVPAPAAVPAPAEAPGAPATPKSPLQILQTMKTQNAALIERQNALLLKLEELHKEAAQIKFLSKRG